LSIKISLHEDEVERGETQKVTVTVSNKDDRDVKIANAKTMFTVYPPEDDRTTANDKTNDEGEANFKVKIDDNAELGIYDIKVKVSKSGYDSATEESSFEVVGSPSQQTDSGNDDDSGNDNNDVNDNKDDDEKNTGDNDDDDDNKDMDNKEQAITQGNACGNGLLSTNVFCQNVANQLHGDGNAINIIAIQRGSNGMRGNDGGYGGHVSNPSLSSPPPSLPSSSSSSSLPSIPETSGGQDRIVPLSNDESLASIVERYKQARIDEAVELRMKYLNRWY